VFSRRVRVFLAIAGVAVLVVAVEGGLNLLHRHRTLQALEALRDQVYDARVAADACRNELAYTQRLFERFDTLVDSLHQEVRKLEALDSRGVPQPRYGEYLKDLHAYNDSVASWHLKADSLKAREATCRRLAETHNTLADSLKRRLKREGIPVS
jgi:uncharacterized protein YdcH (DUF465 family)